MAIDFTKMTDRELSEFVLKMAVGREPVDLRFDANNDGKVTSADALQAARGFRPTGTTQSTETVARAAAQPVLGTTLPQPTADIRTVLPGQIPGGTGNIIANLPTIRTGAADSTSKIDPTLRPYLETGLQRAEQLFFGDVQPSLYSGQMYVSPSQQTQEALNIQEQLARGVSPVLSAAQTAFLSGLQTPSAAMPLYADIYGAAATRPGQDVYQQAAAGQFVNPALEMTRQTAAGGFLQGSPYQQAMMEAATRPLTQRFQETVLPGISSQFSQAGRYGSGAMARAQGQATEAYTRALGDITAGIAGAEYGRERGFQEAARGQLGALGQQDIATRLTGAAGLQGGQQAALATQLAAAGGVGTTQQQELGRFLTGAQMAPSLYGQQFLPSQTLAQIGASREQIAAQPLQEAIQRYQYSQQLPYQQLQGFLSSVYGTPMASSQFPQMPQAQTNRLGQAIGGAGLGYLAGQTFGFNPVYGAIGGGLLGGLL